MAKEKRFRTLLAVAFTLFSVAALSPPAGFATNNVGKICDTCEANCYRDAENVDDYNNCIRVVCNYGLGCDLPIIE